MSLAERDRKPRHVKKGKDMRKHVKDKNDNRWAQKEMQEYKSR